MWRCGECRWSGSVVNFPGSATTWAAITSRRWLSSLSGTLEEDGHVVVTANGGKVGIEVFRDSREDKKSFDVVITDLGMGSCL